MNRSAVRICVSITILALSLGGQGAAADSQPGYCDDLYSVTCAPGASADPWGVSTTAIDQHELDQAILAKRDSVTAQFRKLIEDKDKPYFKKVAQSLLGYSNSPECQFDDAKNISECNRKTADGLFNLAATKISTLSSFKATVHGTLEDLQNLTDNAEFRGVVKGLEQDLRKKYNTDKQQKNIKDSVFPDIRKRLAAVIERLPIDPQAQKFMLEKVKSISYSGGQCVESNNEWGAITLDNSLVDNAMYSSTRNDFHMCGGLIVTSSEFTLAWVIAHELAHSIDPCMRQKEIPHFGMTSGTRVVSWMEDEYYAPALIKCLRDEKSVGAKRLDGPMAGFFRAIFGQDKALCKEDRIGEATADWFATEVTAQIAEEKKLSRADAVKTFSNIFKFTCGETPPDSDVHPPPKDRVNRIILQNPKIRGQLGCGASSSYGYCDAKDVAPQAVQPPQPNPDLGAKPEKVKAAK